MAMITDDEVLELVTGAAADCPCLGTDTDCSTSPNGCYHNTGEDCCRNCDGSGVKLATQLRIAYVQGLKRAKECLVSEDYAASTVQDEISRTLGLDES